MTHPIDDTPFDDQVRDELVRIGLGGGLNLGGQVTRDQLLAALRATPDGAGAQALFARLSAILDGSADQ